MVFKTVLKIFWEYLKLNPIYIVYNIFFMIITVINNFYLPKIYGEFYDTFQKNINLFMYSFIFSYYIYIIITHFLIFLIGFNNLEMDFLIFSIDF